MANKNDLFDTFENINDNKKDTDFTENEENAIRFSADLFGKIETPKESSEKADESVEYDTTKEKAVKEESDPETQKEEEAKPVKVEKVKEPKPPKEKKVKEPKPPKEKKVKEPKPPKEKKVKEPKPPKEKKVKEPKPPKEKKVKEPKPPKVEKVKKPKAEKVKKEKSTAVEKQGAEFEEQLTKKDHITFVLVLFTLVLAIAFVVVKFLPVFNQEKDATETTTEMADIAQLRIDKENVMFQYVQSDLKNVFYSWSPEYVLQYYQYNDNKIKPVQPTGKVTAKVKMGDEELSVNMDYVQVEEGVFGIAFYNVDTNLVYKKVVFKLTNLPKGFEQEGKALLLATTDTNAMSGENNKWTDSFVVDMETGKATRFLSNTETDSEKVAGFSVITDEAYMTTDGKIPFFSTRKHEAISGKRDLYIKEGTKETAFAEDVYGDYVVVDGATVIYMRATENGFNVVKKAGEEETVVFAFKGDFSLNYLYHNEYLLDKKTGKLYNVKTGEEKQIKEYKMLNPESIVVSADGKNLVVLGTAKNVVDYQLYIFNLDTGKCIKYQDVNFSKHTNIAFVTNTVVMYTAVSPEKGYENIMFDIAKIKK